MNRSFAILGLASLAFAALVGPASAFGPPHPPRPPRPHGPHHAWASFKVPPRPLDPASAREIKSGLCATTERAEADLRRQLEATVKDWLTESGVPRSWTSPDRLIDRLVAGQKVYIEPVAFKDLNVFRAAVTADFSEHRKRELLEVYHRHEGGRRLAFLGGLLVFLLACLAAISGYIRADEATKGYYTNRLRLLAAAGVGAAGMAVYQVLT